MKHTLRILFFSVVLALISTASFAQYYSYGNPFRFFMKKGRYQWGVHYGMMNVDFKSVVPVYNQSGTYIYDTILTRNSTSVFGLGYSMGNTLPLQRIGRKSILALGVDLYYNSYVFDLNNKPVYTGGSEYTTGFNTDFQGAVVTQMALPVSLDVKLGGDALPRWSSRFGMTLGAGVFPQYNSMVWLDNSSLSSDSRFAVSPFVKFEFSFIALICMKLRANYVIGDVLLQEGKATSFSMQDVNTNVTSKSNLTVGLLFMPFTAKWVRDHRIYKWWEDYDTDRPWKFE